MQFDIPFYSQHDESIPEKWRKSGCGCTALKMALEYLVGEETPSVSELIMEGASSGAYIDGIGWRHDGLVALAKTYGTNSYREEFKNDKNLGVESLKEKLEKGHTPIVSIARDHNDSSTFHLVPLTGFDDNGFYYNDSSYDTKEEGKGLFVGLEDFLKLWRGLAIFVYK